MALQQGSSYQNVLIHLKKLCNHPFLTLDESTIDNELWEANLISASGKLIVLSKLLTVLMAEKHKLLILTQLTSTMDILEDFLHLRQIGKAEPCW